MGKIPWDYMWMSDLNKARIRKTLTIIATVVIVLAIAILIGRYKRRELYAA